MAQLSTLLKGSTLVESLVAMIIIVGAFGIGTLLFLTVLSGGQSQEELKASIIASNTFARGLNSGVFINATFEVEKFIVEKTFTGDEESEVHQLNIQVLNTTGKSLYNETRMVR